MNNFQKRALAYNAYRALRKLASKSNNIQEITTSLNAAADSKGNGTITPPADKTSLKTKTTPGLSAKSNISRPVKTDWYRKISKGKKGCH